MAPASCFTVASHHLNLKSSALPSHTPPIRACAELDSCSGAKACRSAISTAAFSPGLVVEEGLESPAAIRSSFAHLCPWKHLQQHRLGVLLDVTVEANCTTTDLDSEQNTGYQGLHRKKTSNGTKQPACDLAAQPSPGPENRLFSQLRTQARGN